MTDLELLFISSGSWFHFPHDTVFYRAILSAVVQGKCSKIIRKLNLGAHLFFPKHLISLPPHLSVCLWCLRISGHIRCKVKARHAVLGESKMWWLTLSWKHPEERKEGDKKMTPLDSTRQTWPGRNTLSYVPAWEYILHWCCMNVVERWLGRKHWR